MSTSKSAKAKDSITKDKKKASDSKTYVFEEVSGFTGSKIFDSLLLYGIENCDRLRNTTSSDTFPLDKYYDLEGKLGHTKGACEKKKTPFNTGRHGKVIIQYLCSRFTWEVKQIDIKKFSPVDISSFILKGVAEIKPNLSELIINTVDKVPISNLIKKSHGLEQELMTKIGAHIDDIDLNFYIAKTLVRFIKILAFNFSNEFWYNKSKTIGERNFLTVLAGCESYMPLGADSFHGIMSEMDNFLKDTIKKADKGENKKKESNEDDDDDDPDKSNEEENEDHANDSDSSKSSKKPKHPVKSIEKKKKKSEKDDHEHGDSDNSQSSNKVKGKGKEKTKEKVKPKKKEVSDNDSQLDMPDYEEDE